MSLRPFLTKPIYQPWVWGGRNLARVLGRELPAEGPVAESWEVSDIDGMATAVESEPHVGKSLRELVLEHGRALLGRAGAPSENGIGRFPLLVKYLDAEDRLSVQVHPDDDYAALHEHGSPGKTEMWFVVEAMPGAEVIAALQPGVGKDDLRHAVRKDRVPEMVQRHAVSAGDVILIPAGRVHALGKGVVVLEIQQTSNATYRLYDWRRLGADGRPRDLHVERALEVIDFADHEEPKLIPVTHSEIWGGRRLLAVTRYFLAELWDTRDSLDPAQPVSERTTGYSPDVLMFVKGRGRIRWDDGALDIPAGRTAVVPASLGAYTMEPLEPWLVVRSRVPDLAHGLGDWDPTNADEQSRIREVCDRPTRQLIFGER